MTQHIKIVLNSKEDGFPLLLSSTLGKKSQNCYGTSRELGIRSPYGLCRDYQYLSQWKGTNEM